MFFCEFSKSDWLAFISIIASFIMSIIGIMVMIIISKGKQTIRDFDKLLTKSSKQIDLLENAENNTNIINEKNKKTDIQSLYFACFKLKIIGNEYENRIASTDNENKEKTLKHQSFYKIRNIIDVQMNNSYLISTPELFSKWSVTYVALSYFELYHHIQERDDIFIKNLFKEIVGEIEEIPNKSKDLSKAWKGINKEVQDLGTSTIEFIYLNFPELKGNEYSQKYKYKNTV